MTERKRTERKSDERRPSDEDQPKFDKETVKDLDPGVRAEDVKGGVTKSVQNCVGG